jgi:alpha-L-fucosidase
VAGETNWNTISTDTIYAGKAGIENLLNTGSPDGNKWVPAEVDVSIRPGWFYHAAEDSLVKTPEQLFDIYLTSVGRGSTLLLNIPPDKRGLFHEKDVKSLYGFKKMLEKEFAKNLALKATVKADSYRGNSKSFSPQNMVDGNKETYWTTNDDVNNAAFEISLPASSTIQYIMLQEYIKLGQRVKSFTVEIWENDTWKKVAEATTIGYKRILKIDRVKAKKIRVNITDAKACPVISNVAIY